MSATDAVGRLLVLVPWLLERPGAHVDEAAAAVASDRRTVLDDLQLLNFCGLPGRFGGDLFEVELVGDRILLHLAPTFERPLRPSREEALRLVLSLDHVAAVLGEELPGLDQALTAVRRVAGVPDGVRAAPEPATAQLAPLRRAVADQLRAVLQYRGRADASARAREVDPWELLLHRGVWYLHAHDRQAGAMRTFRLDRIEEVAVGDEPVLVPRPAGDLPLPAYHPGPDDTVVDLTVLPSGHWVLDLLDGAEVEHGEDGRTRARIATDAPRWIVALVLAARGGVVVQSPASLREQVVRTATAGIGAYREQPPLRPAEDVDGASSLRD